MKTTCLIIILFLSAAIQQLQAQEYSNPESVAYDPDSGLTFVSNPGNGTIIASDTNGQQWYFVGNLTRPLGLLYDHGVLWVADSATIVGWAREGDYFGIRFIDIAGAKQLNGITRGKGGILYASDRMGKCILRIDPESSSYDTLHYGGIDMPNGLILHDDTTLLVVNSTTEASIFLIDTRTGNIRCSIPVGYAFLDGITRLDENRYIISSWGDGWMENRLLLLTVNPDSEWDIRELLMWFGGMADIHYFSGIQQLLIPAYFNNTLLRLRLDEIEAILEQCSDDRSSN